MNFFKNLDFGFYLIVGTLSFLFFLWNMVNNSIDERMARLGYVQVIEIVNVTQAQKVWVKSKGPEKTQEQERAE